MRLTEVQRGRAMKYSPESSPRVKTGRRETKYRSRGLIAEGKRSSAQLYPLLLPLVELSHLFSDSTV